MLYFNEKAAAGLQTTPIDLARFNMAVLRNNDGHYIGSKLLPEKLRIRLGILDSDITERPTSHNVVTSKANWDDLNAKLPRYDTYEPTRQWP